MKNFFLFISLLCSIIASAQIPTLPPKQINVTGSPATNKVLYGDRWDIVRVDTADFFGIDSSLTFSNVTELRATQLYSKGGRLATTFGYTTRNDGGGSDYIWNATSTATDDGIFIFKPTAISSGSPGRWEWRAKGKVRASEVGVKSDGTDQTSTLNSLFSLSTVKEVLFDNGDVKITGKVNGQSKKLRFENGARIVGASGSADTLTNALIDADYKKIIFDTLLTVRNIQNSIRSVVWFGAIADYQKNGSTPSPTNNLTAFNNCTNAGIELLTTLTGGTRYSNTIKIPSGETDYFYYIGDQWFINQACNIEGDGIQHTVLKFPSQLRKAAIKIPLGDYNVVAGGYTGGGLGTTIHDLRITGNTENSSQAAGAFDTLSHGLEITAPFVEVKRIKVDKFRGNGINIEASVGATPATNSNCGRLDGVHCENNSGDGLRFYNSDANAWQVIGGNFQLNGKSGIHTQDCLGQWIAGTHTSGNGYLNIYQHSTVSFNHFYYVAITTNTGHRPDAADWYNYWYKMAAGDPDGVYVAAWDTTKEYIPAAGYFVDGASDFTTITGAYAELDQNQYLNKGNGIAIGGFAAGTGTAANNSIGSFLGQLNTRSLWFMNQQNYGARVSGGDVNTGLMPHLGGYDYNRNRFAGWYYTTDDNGQTFRLVGDFGFASPLIFYDQTAANYAASTGTFGREGAGTGNYNMSSAGEILFPNGFYGSGHNSIRRHIEFADAAPSSGYHAAGDIVINNGAASGTVMWKCTVAGTPGTWVAETTGGGFSASITSPQTNQILKYNGSNWVNDDNAILGGLQVQSDNIDLTGAGLELYYQTFTGYINAIGRDGTGWRPLNIQASTISLNPSGAQKFLLDGSKLTLADYAGTGNRITSFNSSGDVVRGSVDPANIVDASGSYSNPSWITSLSGTKVLPSYTGNDGKVLKLVSGVPTWDTDNTGGGGGVADPGANGVMVRTASNTTTARTLTGTSNRISITDGDGVSGNPTFDIGSDVVTLSGTQTFTGSKSFVAPIRVNTSGGTQVLGMSITNRGVGQDYGNYIFYNTVNAFTTSVQQAAGHTGNHLIDIPDADGTLLTHNSTATLSNKSINWANNTVTMTTAQMNTALSDNDIATLAGTETLTNKTIAAATNNVEGTLVNIRFLTSGTTYTPTTGTTKALIFLIGAGGGGGGASGANTSVGAAGGGGAGGLAIKYINNISGTYTYSIGTAGTAGANTGGNGGVGGNTTFVNGATTITAFGGSGGIGQTAGTAAAFVLGGAGAVVSTNGDMNAGGSPGLMAYRVSGTLGYSGTGGDTEYGGAGQGLTSAGAGNAATGFGAGGGGALSTANTNRAGGAGGGGLIVIYEYR